MKHNSAVDVLVLGAGAAGLMYASLAAGRGHAVTVLDPGPRPGRKVLISGGGRANFTNIHMSSEHFQSQNPHFVKSALSRLSPREVMDYFSARGALYEIRPDGKVFMKQSSSHLLNILLADCKTAGVKLMMGQRATVVERADDAFTVRTDGGQFTSRRLVVATGGKSYPELGASGFGYELARTMGLGVIEPRAALVPLTYNTKDKAVLQELSGISFSAQLRVGGREFAGDVLLTHRGISGPAVLEASLHWSEGMAVEINFLPGVDVLKLLKNARDKRAKIASLICPPLPKRLAATLGEHWLPQRAVGELSVAQLKQSADVLERFTFMPGGTEGYRTAEVTSGGVDTRGLSSKTMEASTVPGLYFIGEVMDVTGTLGGYNLHWAWASAHAAASAL